MKSANRITSARDNSLRAFCSFAGGWAATAAVLAVIAGAHSSFAQTPADADSVRSLATPREPAAENPAGADSAAASASSRDATAASLEDPSTGSEESAWGDFPAAADSTTALFETRHAPTWQKVVDVPYEIIAFPFHLVGKGVEATINFSEDIGATRFVRNVFQRRYFPPYTSVKLRAGGQDGFGATIGIAYPEMPGHGNTVRARLDASTRGDRGASLGADFGTVKDGEVQFGVGYRLRPHVRFYGIGPDTREEDESIYLDEGAWGAVSYERALGGGFSTKAAAHYTTIAARGTFRDDEPPLQEVFPGEPPTGFHERSEGVTSLVEVEHNDAPERTRPNRGGLRRGKVAYFAGNDDVRFWTWRAEVQHFLPLWFTRRSLAVRGVVTKIEPQGDSVVPFQRLMTNDDPDVMRGYKDLRFRDLGMAFMNVEYRWPIWSLDQSTGMGIDLYAFTDVGQVFSDWNQVSTKNVTDSYGGGFRLGSRDGLKGRLEFAWSEEGWLVRLRADQLFQFEKDEFLRGRISVPER
jgi:hypothetical protein